MERVKKKYLHACQELERTEAAMDALLNNPFTVEKTTDKIIKKVMKRR
jgi:hypothetical protein